MAPVTAAPPAGGTAGSTPSLDGMLVVGIAALCLDVSGSLAQQAPQSTPAMDGATFMKAMGLMKHGAPEVLEMLEIPERHAGRGEIKARVHAAAVDPSNTLTRSGTLEKAVGAPVPGTPQPRALGTGTGRRRRRCRDRRGHRYRELRVGDPVMAVVIPTAVTVPTASASWSPPRR